MHKLVLPVEVAYEKKTVSEKGMKQMSIMGVVTFHEQDILFYKILANATNAENKSLP